MKWRLHTKLILSFLLVIVVPLFVIAVGLFISIPGFVRDDDLQDVFHINNYLSDIVEKVEQQYIFIENYDAFNLGIKPYLIKFDGHLIIIDNSGILLFDSKDKQASLTKKEVNLDLVSGFDSQFQERNPGAYKYTHAVIVDNKSVANSVIVMDMNAMIQKTLVKTVYHVGGSFLLGLVSLVGLIGLFSYLISRSILMPIRELYKAVDSISQGDIDFKINYTKENELGKLCMAFNTMSSRLKESLHNQALEVEARKELIAGISHDLRTPIASIKGYVEGLQDGIVQDKKMFDRYLSVIADKTNKLDRLIDDLFQLSQLELGNLKLDLEIKDSQETFLGILKDYELDFERETIKYTIIEPIPSVMVSVDSHRIALIFDNILQNAKRVVPNNGKITVGAMVEGDLLKIYIKDNGPGISKEDMPHIFNRFYRGEKSRSREYGGTGLGLSICNQIIQKHMGEIWADSTLGQGTTFFFTLPVVKNKIVEGGL